ncbi:MAG TPA: hypothetical protein VMV87_19940 [Burkholderiales bacterium]|nr:hypothetical protein [Burkholderiales bacterium]
MMREILGVTQDGSEVKRRWFHDDYFDLFVWQAEKGEIVSFELCYGVDSNERALVWRKDHGWFQDGKTTVDPVPRKILGSDLSPAHLADTDSADPVASRFEIAARSLPDDIRSAVAARLREYAEKATVTARRKRVRRAAWQKDIPGSD